MYDNRKKHEENVLNQRDGKSEEMGLGLTYTWQGRINRYTPESQLLISLTPPHARNRLRI
jgi:hypothetical protein